MQYTLVVHIYQVWFTLGHINFLYLRNNMLLEKSICAKNIYKIREERIFEIVQWSFKPLAT